MNPAEIAKLQAYLRTKFNSKTLELKKRPKIKDSVEVYFGEEFIGTLTRDDEDGDLAYQFQMTILDFDLEEGAASK